jgi:cell division protein FtsL
MNRRMKGNKKRVVLKLSCFLYIVLCLFSIIWLRATVVNLEYEIGELDKMRADLRRESKMVVAQRANFYSTGKIENVALKRLGMTMPERQNVYFVKRRRVAGPYRASMK